jgi:hypothetical protein
MRRAPDRRRRLHREPRRAAGGPPAASASASRSRRARLRRPQFDRRARHPLAEGTRSSRCRSCAHAISRSRPRSATPICASRAEARPRSRPRSRWTAEEARPRRGGGADDATRCHLRRERVAETGGEGGVPADRHREGLRQAHLGLRVPHHRARRPGHRQYRRDSTRNGTVVASFPVGEKDQIMLVTDGGQMIRCPVHDIRVAGRQTQGVIGVQGRATASAWSRFAG